MVTIQTLGFQPLTIDHIEHGIPPHGGIYILARRTGATHFDPFLVRKTQNLRAALRRFLYLELDTAGPAAKKRSIDDCVNRVWVRIIPIEEHNHRSELERILSSELLGDNAGNERCF